MQEILYTLDKNMQSRLYDHAFAVKKMNEIDSDLTEKFEKLVLCLSMNPELAPKPKSESIQQGSREHIEKLAISFAKSREPKTPKTPSTVPDKMVSEILNIYYDVPRDQLEEAKMLHAESMGAENIIGDLLERYIASVIEPQGWVWCSGSTMKAIDFICPPINNGGCWRLLQIKNRDNTENSSSSAIRAGTTIEKWFRTFSRKDGTNWGAFPCVTGRSHLSEEGFISFTNNYLGDLR